MAVGPVLLVTLLLQVVSCAVVKNKTVYILSLLPYPDPLLNPSWREGPAISLALDMAQDEINNQTELLPDYRIQLLQHDSGCEFTSKAYESFLRNGYYTDRNMIGILGPACSKDAVALTRLTSKEDLALLTLHGAGTPLLSNRTLYPYALSSFVTQDLLSDLGKILIERNKRTRVGILFDESLIFYFSLARNFRKKIADSLAVNVFSSAVYDSFYIPLEEIINQGLRITFLFTPVDTAQRILCLARHLGMVFDAYQWIVISNFFEEVATSANFTYGGRVYYCSQKDMIEVALNGVSFLNSQLSAFNKTTPSTYAKHSYNEYDQLFREKIYAYNSQTIDLNYSVSYSVWTTYFYDSLWAWSVALDHMTRKNPGLDLTKYQYGDTSFSDMLLEEFYKLDFEGVSGRIRFHNDSGSVSRGMSVSQVQKGQKLLIAYFSEEAGLLQQNIFENISDHFSEQTQNIPDSVAIVFLTIALLQLVLVTSLHVLSIKYRHYPSVKASSFKLNQLLYTGCYLFNLVLLLSAIAELFNFSDFTARVVCNLIWAWLLPISFTVNFGTVAVRNWQLYRIFYYFNPGRFVRDYYLISFVLLLVLVDIVVGTLWMAFDPLRVEYRRFSFSDGVAKYQINKRLCISENSGAIYATVFGVKVILMISVLLLCVLTRKIKRQTFSTKSFRVLLYAFSADMIIGFGVYYISRFTNPSSQLSTIALLVTLNLMLFLFISLVFFPPVMPLLREKISDIFCKKIDS